MKNLEYGEGIRRPISGWVKSIAERLKSIRTVRDVEIVHRDILKIKRKMLYSDIILYVVDAYSLGEGDVFEIIQDNPSINCILVCSNWNHYSEDAEKLAMEYGVGLFKLSELMGAMNYNGSRFLEYKPPKRDDEDF